MTRLRGRSVDRFGHALHVIPTRQRAVGQPGSRTTAFDVMALTQTDSSNE